MANKDPYHLSEEDFFKKVELPFEKSKEEVWATMFEDLDEKELVVEQVKTTRKVVRMPWSKMAAAAAVVLLVGLMGFVQFYTETISSGDKNMAVAILPDGSSVDLNINSTISYQPYWWRFGRTVHFEGEGFFEVKEGSTFKVVSKKGITEVLGTSFNINTRNDHYQVFCKTGKVRVSNRVGEHKAELTPNMMVDFKEKFKVKPAKESKILSWKEARFSFESKALSEVLIDLEKYYDIRIELEDKSAALLKYTGNFKKTNTAEDVLNLICQSFGFTFVEIDEKQFRISPKK